MPLQPRTANRKSQILGWQGWTLHVPANWNPVKISGDFADGSLLLADLHAARLGLRWTTPGRRQGVAHLVSNALRAEVGKIAADDAAPFETDGFSNGTLYRESDPPGRDVFVGYGGRSNRLLEIVHHVDRRSDAFADAILPALSDTSADDDRVWSIFDLSLRTPGGCGVRWYRFNAGDLSIGLERVPPGLTRASRGITVVRQIGPASLALARQSLDAWTTQMPSQTRKLYRPVAGTSPATLDQADGRTLDGLSTTLERKRRLWWAWPVERRQHVLVLHDEARDRLLLGRSADEKFLRHVLATVGLAAEDAS